MKSALVLTVAFAIMFPLFWMALGSLQPIQGILAVPPRFPLSQMSLDNYARLLANVPVFRWVLNTIVIGVGAIGGSVLVSATSGYALAHRWRGSSLVFAAVVTCILVPRYVLILPHYLVVRVLGIMGTVGAIMPALIFPVGIILFRNFVRGLPNEFREVARMDGASEWRIIRSVMAPLCKPALGVLAILTGMQSLQDYLWQMLMLRAIETRTLIVGLIGAVLREGRHWMQVNPIGMSLATGVLLFLPLLAVFAGFQRYFTEGIAQGGIK